MSIEIKKSGRKPRNPEVYEKLKALNKGESVVVKHHEWENKIKLGSFHIRKVTGREYKVNSLADDSGWYVTAL